METDFETPLTVPPLRTFRREFTTTETDAISNRSSSRPHFGPTDRSKSQSIHLRGLILFREVVLVKVWSGRKGGGDEERKRGKKKEIGYLSS